jgi:hypothetical protein
MKRALEAYQYVAPALLTPIAALLWWRHYDGVPSLAAIALAVPITHAYVVPGIGTNLLHMWEFNTRWRLGRFRPHHGFVFGSATAILVLPVIGAPAAQWSAGGVAIHAVGAAVLLGLVNWIYDAAAIRAGILTVYNQPWADGRGALAIAADYAPWFFGGFGLLYVGGLKAAESLLSHDSTAGSAALLAATMIAATTTLPTVGYVLQSYLRHGHHGCRPVAPRMERRT